MLAGATLTVAVTFLASFIGPAWSGLLAVFPVLGIVLAVFSHRAHGASFAAALLRAMATGLYSFFVFCLVLAVALPHLGISGSFATALAMSLVVQTLTGQHLTFVPGDGLRPRLNFDVIAVLFLCGILDRDAFAGPPPTGREPPCV
jgi:hypothetical protein